MGIWGYLLGAVIIFLFFKEGVLKKIKELQKWWNLNKSKFKEWEGNQEIMGNYKQLQAAIEAAKLDRKWSLGEIGTVLLLAGKLISSIKKYEGVE